MKAKKRRNGKPEVASAARREFPWVWVGASAAALCVVFWAYGPALRGEFLFDDANLPFAQNNFNPPLSLMLSGARKLLMLSYWVNARISQDDPFSYHATGVLIHAISAALVFLIVRKLLEWSQSAVEWRDWLAGFAAALFLLHPAQTEAVAYIAGRSEALSAMFFFAAFTVFLYRRAAEIRWIESALVLLLFLAALLSKEQTMVLPALLLLTDYWWNPGFSIAGIRRNWRVYVPLAVGAVLGLAVIWRVIQTAETAGFQLKDFTWYQYFFTQCRALFVYMGIFLFPFRLNADWNFPISYTVLQHGAIVGLLAMVSMAVVAWHFRRRLPLATFGFLTYLVLMAPTSSILPIQDAVAERRLYFSMLGLLLIVVDLVSRIKVDRRKLAYAGAAVLLVATIATHARADVWSGPVQLWEDTVAKSPDKFRARFQLGYAYYLGQRYDAAVAQFQKAALLPARATVEKVNLLVDWGLALEGAGHWNEGIEKLREAAAIEPTAHIYSQIGMIYAKNDQYPPALEALDHAQTLDSGFTMTYIYRGQIFEKMNNPAAAWKEFQKALQLDPNNPANDQVRQELQRLRMILPAGQGR